MNRRALVAGLLASAISTAALASQAKVRLPELSTARPLPYFGPNVADRRFLKDLWVNLREFKAAHKYDVTNDQVEREIVGYLDAIKARMPVTFIGYDPRVGDGKRLVEVTFNRLREKRRPDGCRELYLDITVPHLNVPERDTEHLVNIDCPRA